MVKLCDSFREVMKKDDPDRRCFISEEFCENDKFDERLEHGSWYRKVTACSRYDQEETMKWAESSRCKKWGHKGGPCGGKGPWNDPKVIAKYREGAKEPYNIDPSFKLGFGLEWKTHNLMWGCYGR
ncbi:hypothetical protein NA56DRAFT_701989 [Hyaloscypha hepaticicola]|uniref:Uncharacterized protein n=1 Tax=Hyaloscypha hepaticicola TaxID=2082293 RepID=A0A2J6Q9H9_9HELO|nr:hypothetical protein NA56DRAFT_701989 [Hyaloscypha hepaticicola]